MPVSSGLVEFRFNGAVYDCGQSETVLEALLRQDAAVPFSCRNGICLTCMMRRRGGSVPAAAQKGLKDTLRLEGHFLPCVCRPEGDLDLELPDDAEIYRRAVVRAVEPLAPKICRVTLESATPLYCRAGQFVNLRRADGLVRSSSLASVPRLDDHLELKVWRVYLCGYPPMVKAARKAAFLMGASLADIHADPFELQDLRSTPRD